MKYTVHVGNQPVVLEHGDFEEHIDVDALTTTDTSNIFGEIVTISAAANRIGMLKSEVEERLATSKLQLKKFEADYKAKLRREAAENKGVFTIKYTEDGEEKETTVKLTEKALEGAFETDSKWIELKQKVIKDEGIVGKLSSLYWSVQQKCRSLSPLASNVTPEEFVSETIEGKINGILIKK